MRGRPDYKPCKHPCCPDSGPCRKAKTKKIRKPLRRVSKKRARENKVYSTLRKQFLEEKQCAARLEGCTGVATDVHHAEGRVGEKFLDVSTWKGLCRNCHQVVEKNPLRSKQLNLSKSRLAK